MQRRPVAGGGCSVTFILLFHSLVRYAFIDTRALPTITAGIIISSLITYLRPLGRLSDLLPTPGDACFDPLLILQNWDIRRVFLSTFYHVDDTHLVYNMLSLLWKGVQLELRMGSLQFAKTVIVLIMLSQSIMVVFANGLALLVDTRLLPSLQCTIGFSGVLFGMKVILNLNSPTHANVYGILVPTRYVAWFELVLVQAFVPGVSFFSHVCGILAGVLYIRYSHMFMIDALTIVIGHSASMVGCALKRCRRLLCTFLQSRNNHLA